MLQKPVEKIQQLLKESSQSKGQGSKEKQKSNETKDSGDKRDKDVDENKQSGDKKKESDEASIYDI